MAARLTEQEGVPLNWKQSSMKQEHILAEIRRTTAKNGGPALGRERFEIGDRNIGFRLVWQILGAVERSDQRSRPE